MSNQRTVSVDNSTWVSNALSPERFQTYLNAVNGDTQGALELYRLNASASAELFTWLGLLEVVLRNSISRTLTPVGADSGFDHIGSLWQELTPAGRSTYENTKRRLLSQGKPLTPQGLITELPMSFWRYLLSATYQNSLWATNRKDAFPQLWPKDRSRVYAAVEGAVALRNRIAHHEPIFRRLLGADLAQIQQIIGWISPEALEWARQNLPTKFIGG